MYPFKIINNGLIITQIIVKKNNFILRKFMNKNKEILEVVDKLEIGFEGL